MFLASIIGFYQKHISALASAQANRNARFKRCKVRFCVFVGMLMCSIGQSYGVQQTSPSAAPLSAMQRLALLKGQWQSTMSISYDKGKTWQAQLPNEVEVSQRLNGMLLEQKNVTQSHNGWNIVVHTAYDQYRDKYRYLVSDDTWGMMDIYEGDIVENGDLVVTNLNSKTFFPAMDGRWLAFQIRVEVKACQRKTHIEASNDRGRTWIPYIIYAYSQPEKPQCRE
ncbi:DUF1579 family protein [Alteromonas oceanisediminis]|uniref:DUF1579 family protein n=1 Tax=Alteromonas oceanisediminis TaxID=2836180 RepID=UPI001BD93E3B|nr:DUF1579 family protein [Alteromonas oceanisediminis]MBT0587173.1 DUF1579 family protein [Alteromonas oceanisediminis]